MVVLDEIDYLKTKDQDVLYKLFEWTSLPQSQLVLIGISNALDLTDRILPRLEEHRPGLSADAGHGARAPRQWPEGGSRCARGTEYKKVGMNGDIEVSRFCR